MNRQELEQELERLEDILHYREQDIIQLEERLDLLYQELLDKTE